MRQPAKYILLTCFSLAALIAPEGAFAAKKGLKASPEEIFSVTLANGKALDCLERKGGVMPGTAKTKKGKTRFFPEKDKYRKALAALEQQKNNLGPKKYKKKKKALKEAKLRYKHEQH